MELELLEHASKYTPQKHLKVDDDIEEIVLGRHPDNAICLKSVSISRKHAVIKKTESGYELHEQKAVNRVYVNDVLLPAGATKTLVSNDRIQLGVKPNPSEPATRNSEYFIYKVSFESNRKRRLSSTSPTGSKQAKLESDSSSLINILQQKAQQEAESAAAAAKEEAKARAAAEAKATTEKAELEKELVRLRELQDVQKAKEQALEEEMKELKQKQVEKAEELARQLEDREKEFEEVKDEQTRKSMEMCRKLQEREQELEEAKAQERKLELLEEELKSTKQEQERLSSVSTKMAIQEKITDLLEEQLQCTICSELMIKPKNFACSHAYCGYCIDKWLAKKKECPICRCKVTAATPNYLLSSLIEKAVEELSDELKQNRASVILAREEEMSKNSQAANKGKKKKNAGRQANAPSSAATRSATTNSANNPSTSQSTTANQPTARASTPSNASDGRNSSEEVIDLTSDSEFERLSGPGSPSTTNSTDSEVAADNTLPSSADNDQSTSYLSNTSTDSDDSEEEGYYGGYRRAWGSYGRCFNCGDPGHWRPDCPHR